jgi:hypothetical protein
LTAQTLKNDILPSMGLSIKYNCFHLLISEPMTLNFAEIHFLVLLALDSLVFVIAGYFFR